MKTIRDRAAHAPGCARPRTRRAIPDPPIGAKFGSWTVTGAVMYVGRYRCVPVTCACGLRQTARVDNLANGSSKGCRTCGGWAKRAKLSAAGRRSLMDRRSVPTTKPARSKP